MVEVIFGAKSGFDTYRVIYPFEKEVCAKIRAARAMAFYDASANADQRFIAPAKGHFLNKSFIPKIICQNFSQKDFPASKNEKLQIVRNALCQHFTPIRALFARLTAVRNFENKPKFVN